MRLVLCTLGLALAAATPVPASAPAEHDLKAAYVFNILRFVEHRTIGMPSAVLTLGVHAAGPIENALRSLEGTLVHGRKLLVRSVNDESELPGCDAIFLGRSNGKAGRILAAARPLDLLTIGNDEELIPSGGMIALLVESRKVVVEINAEAIATGGWVVSSHLLEVARLVKRAGS